MAIIKPFRGVLYNKELVKDIAEVTAPPYDVISPDEQKKLYKKHPANIVRLILGQEYKTDTKAKNRYTRAKNLFEKWQEESILVQDEEPSLYYYTQVYALPGGGKLTRKGFLTLLKLEDFDKGDVLRHETILSKPFKDRVGLIKECRANFSPIFMFYSDKDGEAKDLFGKISRRKAHFDFTDKENTRHRMWKVSDSGIIKNIEGIFKKRKLVIADGHHRYTASVKLSELMEKRYNKAKKKNPFGHTLVYLTGMEDKGLAVFPIHRLIHSLKNFDRREVLSKLSLFFNIEVFTFGREDVVMPEVRSRMSKYGETKSAFSLYFRSDKRIYLLHEKKDKVKEEMVKLGFSANSSQPDVLIFHRIICEKILKISKKAQEKQENIIYIKGNEDFKKTKARRDYQMVFLLNPISAADVYNFVKSGDVLPQKSTFFYPKLISGFVINKMD